LITRFSSPVACISAPKEALGHESLFRDIQLAVSVFGFATAKEWHTAASSGAACYHDERMLRRGAHGMTKPMPLTDFRAVRRVLEPVEFAHSDGEEDPPPRDQIDQETWAGIMDLPDDVAIRTSDHSGTRLRLLYTLWGDWIVAAGNPDTQDELFGCMLDANDCLQAVNFDLVHGFYRAAIANLRTALEVVMIGAFANLHPDDEKYLRWKKGAAELGFSYCRGRLLSIYKATEIEWLFRKKAFPDNSYGELCKFTHARPDYSDGALWKSNGPVYDDVAMLMAFRLALDVYSICYLLVKVGRCDFVLPANSHILFELDWMTHHAVALKAYRQLYGDSGL
jgi:hypothetical protein